jgi:hypothetical protein
MRTVNWGLTAAVLGWVALVFGTGNPTEVEARPKYKEMFGQKYPGLAGEVEKVKCGVCHPPAAAEMKKVRNNFGQALGKALNAKNVADDETIKKALQAIESENSAIEGKTFGDLIKAGTLPGKNE